MEIKNPLFVVVINRSTSRKNPLILLSLLLSDSLSLSSRCVRIKCGATKRVRVKARCVMRERDVNFGAFLNFLQSTAQ